MISHTGANPHVQRKEGMEGTLQILGQDADDNIIVAGIKDSYPTLHDIAINEQPFT